MLHASIPLPRKTVPGDCLRTLDAALANAGRPRGPITFHIQHDTPRVLERITLETPVLRPFWKNDRITDAGADVPLPPHDVLLDALATIATGIARRFQVRLFHVHLGTVDWGGIWDAAMGPALGAALPADLGDLPASFVKPGVAYRNGWWISGRQQSVTATLVGEPLPAGAPTPAPPEALLTALRTVVRVRPQRFQVVALPTQHTPVSGSSPPSPADPRRKVRALRIETLGQMARLVSDNALPHTLPPTPAPVDVPPGLDRRGTLRSALAPSGWRHHGPGGSAGMLAFWKPTAQHTRLTVAVDFGTWSKRMAATLTCQGATWQLMLPVQFHSGDFVPTSAATLQQAAENLDWMLNHLCETFVPAIEALYPAGPAWSVAPTVPG